MRKKMVAANWKMNLTLADAKQLVSDVAARLPLLQEHQRVVFCSPSIFLHGLKPLFDDMADRSVGLGAQNCHPKASGAFTGETSIGMLNEAGVEYVLVGHSERRQYFNESNAFLKEKVDALVAANKQVIFCCGEPLDIREANTQVDYVKQQLEDSLLHLSAEQLQANIVIAYEPIWAIGTGKTATTEQAQEMHAAIRALLAATYNAEVANNITILYGGSCNDQNAVDLFSCEDVDGGLIGGAALKTETFLPIVFAMN
ncbi:MAG: triose-phosphate isomerase [Chitinophagaceae bacterium]|nr:triose-phosphate isomerase [Chitinophagaceae bacterium]